MYMQYTLLVSDGCMSSVFAVDAITMSGTGCVEWGRGRVEGRYSRDDNSLKLCHIPQSKESGV